MSDRSLEARALLRHWAEDQSGPPGPCEEILEVLGYIDELEARLGVGREPFALRCTVCGTIIQRTNTRGRPSTVCDADCAAARKKQRRAAE